MDWLWTILIAVRGLSTAPGDEWAVRLAELDRAREAAFAAAEPARLDDVYVRHSSGLRADAAAIEAYSRRGGRVVGAELRILSCRVVRATHDRVQLEVIDQLAPATVVWDDGSLTRLPRDQPSRRSLTVVHTDDGWRIASAGLRQG